MSGGVDAWCGSVLGGFSLGTDRENRGGPCRHATCNRVGSAAKLAQPRIDWTADAQAANQSALIRFKIDHPNRSARFRKNRSDPPGQIPAREETGPPSLRGPSLSSTQTPLSSISGEWGAFSTASQGSQESRSRHAFESQQKNRRTRDRMNGVSSLGR